MAERTVYVVTHGEYSSYGWDFGCESKEALEAWVEKANVGHTDYGIEEMTIHDADSLPPLTQVFYARQQREDIAVRIDPTWVQIATHVPLSGHTLRRPDGSWEVVVVGTDRDRVLKDARDRVASARAQDAGL